MEGGGIMEKVVKVPEAAGNRRRTAEEASGAVGKVVDRAVGTESARAFPDGFPGCRKKLRKGR